MSRWANIDRTPKPCNHAHAKHQHGTPACYYRDRCRCTPCSGAACSRARQVHRDKAYGRHEPFVDATATREHILNLHAAGVPLKTIARQAGIGDGTLLRLLYEDVNRGRPRTRRVRRETERRVLAVKPSIEILNPGSRIDATGSRRRLQALITRGWSMSEVARRVPISVTTLNETLVGGQVTVAYARLIRAVYDELWDQNPPAGTPQQKASITKSLRRAQSAGYAPPLAWGEQTIDDPDAVPLHEVESEEHVLDEVLVARLMAGTAKAPKRVRAEKQQPEVLEAIRRMNARRMSDTEIGERIGWSQDAVMMFRRRNLPETVKATVEREQAAA